MLEEPTFDLNVAFLIETGSTNLNHEELVEMTLQKIFVELGTMEHEETQSATCPTNPFLCNNCLKFVYVTLNYKTNLKSA